MGCAITYTVSEYLSILEAADRAPGTVRQYRIFFEGFGRFLQVPVDEIHNHLSPENLIKYAGSKSFREMESANLRLSLLRSYFEENGVIFSKHQMKVFRVRRKAEPRDKPPTLELWQRMMDLGDERARAFITFSVSTACRPGETAQILLSDVQGDTVTIRPEIAKNKHGGKVYLTAEAREYLDIWLRNRSEFIRRAGVHAETFKRVGIGSARPKKDDRLFASTYSGLNQMFRRLYQKVDGEKGKYRGMVTPHSMRKYFRTQTAQGGLHIDIVEHLMRHTGYLTGSYVRLTDDEIRRAFHEHEDALYITRRDRRHSENQITQLRTENETLERRLKAVEVMLKRER